MNIKRIKKITGFTLVELMVSLAIFALMTALLVAKYGNFNQGILLNNLAYDIALNIRNAQSYGLNVKSAPTASGEYFSNQYNYPYGVHFTSGSNNFILYADVNSDGKFNQGGDVVVSSSTIRKVGTISGLCVGTGGSCNSSASVLDISFKRPDPDAIIKANNSSTVYKYAEVSLNSTDGSAKKIIVRSTGQIAVSNVSPAEADELAPTPGDGSDSLD